MSVLKWLGHMMIVGLLLAPGEEVSAQQSRPDDEITKLADDVYLFRHQFHQAIFIATSQGVIVTDPISAEAATWLTSPAAASLPARQSLSVMPQLGRTFFKPRIRPPLFPISPSLIECPSIWAASMSN
jgi:hypothetical protein